MKYENRLKLHENIIYGVVWTLVFTIPLLALYLNKGEDGNTTFAWSKVFPVWKEMIPFLLLFLVHNYLIAPYLLYRKNKMFYGVAVFCLLVVFAAGQSVLHGNDRRMGPPPGMENGERPPLPPDDKGRPLDGPGSNNEENKQPVNNLRGEIQNDSRPLPPPQRPDGRPDDGGPGARDGGGGPPEEKMPELSRMLMDNPALTNTFIAFLLLSMNLGIKEAFRSVKNQRDTEELRRQHLEQELEYLRYQINPHFFMNTLNNIHALVDIDPEQAKSTIVELSRLMRYVLYDGARPTIPLVKETEFLKHYIALMRLRFSDQVRIDVDIPDEVPDVQVPPLLFVSFVENAFKHGISYQSDSFIMVSLNVHEGYVTFSCINSRHESNQDPHSGIGLENTQKRLKLLFQDNYTFHINENVKTYEVLLKIPVTYDQVSGH